MVNMLSFNLDDFKNEFVGRVAESYGEVIDNTQVWRQLLVRQSRNDAGGWMDIVLDDPHCFVIKEGTPDYPCKYQNVMHQHQSIYATRNKNSPLHRFLVALNDNVKLQITDPDQFKGHTFRFYEWVQPGWTNKKTGQEYKERPYFLVGGWPDQVEEEEVTIEPLIPASAQPSLAQAETVVAPAVNGTTNGTNGVNGGNGPQTQEEFDMMLAMYCDGKSLQQVRNGLIVAKEEPQLTDYPNGRVNIMSGAAMKRLEDNLLINKTEDGVYHLMGV